MASEEYLDKLEAEIVDQINMLRQRHQLELQPFYERLGRIRDARPQRHMITVAEAIAAGLIPGPVNAPMGTTREPTLIEPSGKLGESRSPPQPEGKS